MRTNPITGRLTPERRDLEGWKSILITLALARFDKAMATAGLDEKEQHVEAIEKYLEVISDIEARLNEMRRGRPIKLGNRGRGTGLIGRYMKRAPKANGRPRKLSINFDRSVFLLVSHEMQSMEKLRPGKRATVTSALKRLMLDRITKAYGLTEEAVLFKFGRYRDAYNRGKRQHYSAQKSEDAKILASINWLRN